MKRKLKDKLTFANVMACVAVFIALTGSAYAAFRVPPNSVGSRQLKAKAVTGGKIANEAVSGGKIEAESITGANIKMSALGTVPMAANAANAANANAVGGHSASCPLNTTLIRGLCFDTHSNPVAHSVEEAAEACAPRAAGCPPRCSSTRPRASSTSAPTSVPPSTSSPTPSTARSARAASKRRWCSTGSGPPRNTTPTANRPTTASTRWCVDDRFPSDV